MDKKNEKRALGENDSFRIFEKGDELLIENKTTGKQTVVRGNQLFTTEELTLYNSGRKTVNGVELDAESITIEEGAEITMEIGKNKIEVVALKDDVKH